MKVRKVSHSALEAPGYGAWALRRSCGVVTRGIIKLSGRFSEEKAIAFVTHPVLTNPKRLHAIHSRIAMKKTCDLRRKTALQKPGTELA